MLHLAERSLLSLWRSSQQLVMHALKKKFCQSKKVVFEVDFKLTMPYHTICTHNIASYVRTFYLIFQRKFLDKVYLFQFAKFSHSNFVPYGIAIQQILRKYSYLLKCMQDEQISTHLHAFAV